MWGQVEGSKAGRQWIRDRHQVVAGETERRGLGDKSSFLPESAWRLPRSAGPPTIE